MTRSASDPGDPDFSGLIVYESPLVTTMKSFARHPVRAFKQYNRKQIYASSKRKYSVISKVIRHHAERSSHRDVRKIMRHAAVALARIHLSNTRLIRISSLIGVIPIVVFCYQNQSHNVLISLLAVAPIAIIVRLLEVTKHTSNNWVIATYGMVGVTSGAIAYAQSPRLFNKPWHIRPNVGGWTYLFYLLMALSLYISIIAVPFIILVVQLTNRRVLQHCPDYAASEELGLALEHLAMRGVRAGSLDNKNATTQHLENAAILINDGVPKKLTASNSLIQSALRGKCELAAAAIRELEAKVALADMKALDEIQEIIADIVTAICLGTYDIHLQANPGQVPHLSLTRKLGRASQTLLIGIIPIAMILGFRYGGIKLSSQFNNWAVAIAILWAVIVIISALDPLYKNRLKAVQDFISAFRGGAS